MKKRIVLLLFLMMLMLSVASEVAWAAPKILPFSVDKSGYLAVSDKDHFFYLFVGATQSRSPLMVYLAGGPGASSMAPMVVENGPWLLVHPFRHNKNFHFIQNPFAWNHFFNMLYLDQPRYTGYSYGQGNYSTTLTMSAKDFLAALLAFYQKYPQFRDRPLYLGGESFAGAYIGKYTVQILSYNKFHSSQPILLTGIFIMSGVIAQKTNAISPYYQLDFLCRQKMILSHDCLKGKIGNFRWLLQSCVVAIAHKKHISVSGVSIADVQSSSAVIPACAHYWLGVQTSYKTKPYRLPDDSTFPAQLRGRTIEKPTNSLQFDKNSPVQRFLRYSPNPYNVALPCQPSHYFPAWCYDGYKLMKFFNDSHIKQILGHAQIPNTVIWKFAQFPVAVALTALQQPLPPLASLYAKLLRAKIKVTLIYGKSDWMMNYLSQQLFANQIADEAYHQPLFRQVPAHANTFIPLMVNGKQRGEYKILKNFTFAQIDNAGHLVAKDQPDAVYILLKKFIS